MTSAPEPGYGLVLCSQFTSDDDVVTRFAEQVEQVRFARDRTCFLGSARACMCFSTRLRTLSRTA